MSSLRYEGGDRNDPLNYTLTCKCDAILGPLGRFRVNEDGWRSVMCPACQQVTLVQGVEIKMVSPLQVPKQ
jgi:hypothetical protein